MVQIAGWMDRALRGHEDEAVLATIRAEVEFLCSRFPLYAHLREQIPAGVCRMLPLLLAAPAGKPARVLGRGRGRARPAEPRPRGVARGAPRTQGGGPLKGFPGSSSPPRSPGRRRASGSPPSSSSPPPALPPGGTPRGRTSKGAACRCGIRWTRGPPRVSFPVWVPGAPLSMARLGHRRIEALGGRAGGGFRPRTCRGSSAGSSTWRRSCAVSIRKRHRRGLPREGRGPAHAPRGHHAPHQGRVRAGQDPGPENRRDHHAVVGVSKRGGGTARQRGNEEKD